MPCTSSCSAAVTTSSTERLWPRWITSAPIPCRMRRMMLIAASWPSNRLAAVTKRTLWRGRYEASALYSAESSVMARRPCDSRDLQVVERRVARRVAQLQRAQRVGDGGRDHEIAVCLRVGGDD